MTERMNGSSSALSFVDAFCATIFFTVSAVIVIAQGWMD